MSFVQSLKKERKENRPPSSLNFPFSPFSYFISQFHLHHFEPNFLFLLLIRICIFFFSLSWCLYSLFYLLFIFTSPYLPSHSLVLVLIKLSLICLLSFFSSLSNLFARFKKFYSERCLIPPHSLDGKVESVPRKGSILAAYFPLYLLLHPFLSFFNVLVFLWCSSLWLWSSLFAFHFINHWNSTYLFSIIIIKKKQNKQTN